MGWITHLPGDRWYFSFHHINMPDHSNIPEDKSEIISRQSSDLASGIDGKAPKDVLNNAELVTAKGNIITKDGQVISTTEGVDSIISENPFSDPEVKAYYVGVYEDAKYECRHVFDADLTWSKE
jgi:hypothetical protein